MKSCRGMTLLESVAAMTVMSVIAAMVLPAVSASNGAFATSAEAREMTEDLSFAMDRMVWLLRESPSGDVPGEIAIARVTNDSIEFENGTGFGVRDGDLVWYLPGEEPSVLCAGVESVEIRLLGSDGVTDFAGTPRRVHRYELRLERDDVDIRAAVFPRVRIGSDG